MSEFLGALYTAKLAFLTARKSISGIEWEDLQPDEKHNWLTAGLCPEFLSFFPIGTKETKNLHSINTLAIFQTYSCGVKTNRDSHVYSFNRRELSDRVRTFIEIYNSTVDRYKRQVGKVDPTSLIDTTDVRIKWTRQTKNSLVRVNYSDFVENNCRNCLYRPFTKKYLYFDDFWNEDCYQQRHFFPSSSSETENKTILVGGYGRQHFAIFVSSQILDHNFYVDPAQCFPYYTYAEDGSNRRENITNWALAQFHARYGEQVSKWDIFHYVYALLHHPQYRERYVENLKRELPRIPLLKDRAAFEMFVHIGKQLMELHLNYEEVTEYPLKWVENKDVSVDFRVEKMRFTPTRDAVQVNEWLTLAGIPQECFLYRLGNRSALEWVIDQYQVSTDARSGISSDPNREDEPEYIVRLVGRVVTVSVETMRKVSVLAQIATFPDAQEAPLREQA